LAGDLLTKSFGRWLGAESTTRLDAIPRNQISKDRNNKSYRPGKGFGTVKKRIRRFSLLQL
jgi:hypothetical protein